jgi:hypothetical protein
VVSNFTCESHADFCADPKCGFTRIDLDNIKISYGCDLKVVLNHIEVCSNFLPGTTCLIIPKFRLQLDIIKYQKVKKNEWKRIAVVTYNLCDLAKNADVPLVRIFLSSFTKSLDPSLVHPCPFTVRNLKFEIKL